MTSQIKLIKYYILTACTGLSYLSVNSIVLAEKPYSKSTDVHYDNCNECSLERTEILPNTKFNIQNLKWQRLRSALKAHTQTSRRQVNTGLNLTPLGSKLQLLPDNLSSSEPTLTTQVTPSVTPTESATAVETTVSIKAVQVLGSTVFSQVELDKVVQPFIGQQARFEQLLAIRTAIYRFLHQ